MSPTEEYFGELRKEFPSLIRRPTRSREAVQARDALITGSRLPKRGLAMDAVRFAEEMAAGSFDPAGFFVYLLFDREGTVDPFYIGQSSNIFARLGQHYTTHGVRLGRVKLIRCATRQVMSVVELALIKHYRPPLNIQGVG